MFITQKFKGITTPKYAITVHYKNGYILLSVALLELLDAKIGDRVLFYVSNGKAWICKHEDGFILRAGSGAKRNPVINNKYTTDQLKLIANPIISTVNYKINPEPTKLQGGIKGYMVEI